MTDALEHSVTFLAKRDGIDKVLKLIRYTAKLVLATHGVAEGSAAHKRLKSLDSSLGTTRKALRIGKFLNNVKAAAAVDWHSPHAGARALAAAGEGVYFFIDQFVWLVKSGVLDARHEAALARASAWAELVGYCGSLFLGAVQLRRLREERAHLEFTLQYMQLCGAAGGSGEEAAPSERDLRRRLQAVRAQMLLRSLLLFQDASDTLIALQEVSGGRMPLVNPTVIAICGLVSGSISAWKNWPS